MERKKQMTDDEFCYEYIATKPSGDSRDFMFRALFIIPLILAGLVCDNACANIRSKIVGVLIVIVLLATVPKFVKRYIFLKKIGLNEKQAKRRYEFIKYKKLYMPLVQRMCRLNLRPILKQLDMLKSSFRSTSGVLSEFVFEREYTDEDYGNSIDEIKYKSIEERDTIMEILFQIAVLEDGIHDDEWDLLTSIMERIYPDIIDDNYKKEKIEAFVNKYSPFRKSFAGDANENDKKTEESQRRVVPPHLKPYYAILGIAEDASDKDIKQAYHKLALQYHPDLLKNADRVKECDAKMAKINEAYDKVRGKIC